MRTRKTVLLAAIAITIATSSALAAPAMPWSTPSGSATDFTYTGGGDDNGLFGEPLIVGNSFFFFPSNFRAESDGDQNVNDRMEVNIHANLGFDITGVVIQELGDYQITGTGEVSVSGTLQLVNLDIPFPPQVRQAPLLITQGTAGVINGTDLNGPWDGSANQDLSGESIAWDNFSLVLTNELVATATSGVSSIEKTFTGGAVVVTVVPEPASMTLLLLGAASVVARRRKA